MANHEFNPRDSDYNGVDFKQVRLDQSASKADLDHVQSLKRYLVSVYQDAD